MAEHVGHSQFKAALIVKCLAVVVPERLLIEVAKQMKRFDAHISTVDTSLQQRPEVFEAVGVNATVDVLDGVIYDLMRVLPGQSLIGEKEICVEGRTGLNMLLHFGLERILLPVRNDGRDNLTPALKNAHDGYLVTGTATSDAALALGDVHVASLAADERLIGFDLTGELDGGIVVERHADAVQHEPCRLLSDAECAGNFARADAVLAVAENPVSAHPLIEAQGGVLKDRSDLEGELLFAALAVPDLASLDEGVLLRTAARAANNTVREPQVERVLESTVSVREVDDCLLECVRGFHDSRIGRIALCVKYVIALVLGRCGVSRRRGRRRGPVFSPARFGDKWKHPSRKSSYASARIW